MKKFCRANFRILFGTPDTACRDIVLGVFFHDSDSLTLQLNSHLKNVLQVSLLRAMRTSHLMLRVVDTATGQFRHVVIWRDPSNVLVASLRDSATGATLRRFGKAVGESVSADVVTATAATPQYMMILTAPDLPCASRHLTFRTAQCVRNSLEVQWAKAYFQHVHPEAGSKFRVEFHTTNDVAYLPKLRPPSIWEKKWWVYVNGEPQCVTGLSAVQLFAQGIIQQVHPEIGGAWQMIQASGLV